MKAKILLVLIPLALLVLLPLARQPAFAFQFSTPTSYPVNIPTQYIPMIKTATARAILQLTATSVPISTQTPAATTIWQTATPLPYPAPEVNKIGALEHKYCIVIPWFTLDGWKKKEVCYPNR